MAIKEAMATSGRRGKELVDMVGYAIILHIFVVEHLPASRPESTHHESKDAKVGCHPPIQELEIHVRGVF